MAIGEGDAPVSRGGNRGTNQDVPVMERQVKTNAETGVPGYGQDYTSLALTDNTLGKIGSQMALQAGIMQAKNMGTALGSNPEGDLLPAITDVDKAFVDSYSSQAQATLALQVDKLMNDGEEQLNQAYKLNPSMISEFEKSTAEGAQEILSHAPSTVRAKMQNQYASQLMTTSHQLNMKLVNQQKADAKEKIEVYNSSQVKSSFNSAFNGDPVQAKANLDSFKNDLASQRSAGIIDRKQEDSLYNAAKLSYYSGLYSKGAVDAKADKKLPEYLRGMQDKLSKDLSPLDTIAVSNNVLQYMGAVHNAEAQDNQLIVSDLSRSLAEGTLTAAQLSQAEAQLPPTEMNNFMTKLWSTKNARNKEIAETESLANDFTSFIAMSQATTKKKKEAFDALTAKKMQEDPNQDSLQVQTAIARAAGGEFPSFTKQLDAMIVSGGPDDVYRASRAISSIDSYAPQNVASLSPQAKAMVSIFEDLHEAGVNAQDALGAAREQVLNKSKDQQEANDRSFMEYKKSNLATEGQIESYARARLNIPRFTAVPNMPEISNRVMKAWEANYKLTNGNAAAADKLTEKGLARTYGISHVNGQKQFVFMPVEKMVGIDTDGVGLIHNDIVRNVTPQLEATKEAYDKGKVDYYYRVATKENDFVALSQEKQSLEARFKGGINSLKERATAMEDYRNVVKKLRSIDNTGNVEIEKVYRGAKKEEGAVEKLRLSVTASKNMQLSNDPASPISGFYDLGLIDSNGYPAPFAQVSNVQTHSLGYRPDIHRIRQEYTSIHNVGLDTQDTMNQHIEDFISKSQLPGTGIESKPERFRGHANVTLPKRNSKQQ